MCLSSYVCRGLHKNGAASSRIRVRIYPGGKGPGSMDRGLQLAGRFLFWLGSWTGNAPDHFPGELPDELFHLQVKECGEDRGDGCLALFH